ncbi:MAG: nucleoside 2-deoxyribosyltransferase [Reyranella sp.]|uniref:nucleoside 2-deoxyribosyltransferase n=1 Tax=Reyranella sp. TaxID=1929291 RepID=UPI0012112211|nr:nucleoside 2-deoxyribosyltransferase [Reyranella sp.]TAJ41287.1 MAG: nucleoside 2-deoxyribosyltransferase [Reyranella sp.]
MTIPRPQIYLAAPLFNDRERQFNIQLAHTLEEHACVFLPQRNGALLSELVALGVPGPAAERRVFDQDVAAMSAADFLVAVLDGGHIDEGVAFEIGFMCALGRVCIGLQTDIRRALPTGNNPMISQGLNEVCRSVGELIGRVESHVRAGALVHRRQNGRRHA